MQKYQIKTDMEPMKNALKEAGFLVEGNRVYLEDERTSELESCLDRSLAILDEKEMQNNSALEGPKMIKTLGSMPSNRGLSNWMSLLLFLTIDITAIIVGIYLLMH